MGIKLELTWMGMGLRPGLESRILRQDPARGYCVRMRPAVAKTGMCRDLPWTARKSQLLMDGLSLRARTNAGYKNVD